MATTTHLVMPQKEKDDDDETGAGPVAAAAAEGQQMKAAHAKRDDDDNGDFGLTALTRKLASLGLVMKDTVGDGNCLFRALADQMLGNDRDHRRLRLETVDYMRSREDHFKWFVEDGVPFERHCSRMEQDGTFGGNLELVAFAWLYNLDIRIYQSSGEVLVISGREETLQDQKIPPTSDVPPPTRSGTLSKKEERKKRRSKTAQNVASAGDGKGKPPTTAVTPSNVLHITYHSWEHYSSVRNADGPFDGFPQIRCTHAVPSTERTPIGDGRPSSATLAAEAGSSSTLSKKEESVLLTTGTTDSTRVLS